MGFANPILGGGGALVYPSIHSPNFSQGPPIVGWSIDKNGNAFFSGTIGGTNFIINSNGLFIYNQASSGPTVLTFNVGSGNWTAPAGVTAVKAECWGSGGGAGATDGGGGGGSEYACETSLAVTPGTQYPYSVGSAGAGGAFPSNGSPGSSSTMAGDAVTVTAHGGGGGTSIRGSGGTGGSGSTNSIHFNGGNGGTGASSGGGGGGGSGGTSSMGIGGVGGAAGGSGAVAVTGGGPGGNGTNSGSGGSVPSVGPGGGGGGGGSSGNTNGGSGANGQVRLTYTPTASLMLIASICGIAVTDPLLGVNCPEGMTVFASTASVQANLGAAVLDFIDTVNDAQAPGTIGLATVNRANDALQLTSPAKLASDVQAILAIQNATTGNLGNLQISNAQINAITTAAVHALAGSLNVTGPINKALSAYKTNATNRASTTSVTNDPDLQLSLLASSVYVFEIHLMGLAGGTNPGIKYGLSVPSGATGSYTFLQTNLSSALQMLDNGGLTGTNTADAANGIRIKGLIVTSTTPGTLAFQWAQSTSSATNTTVGKFSNIKARRIA